MSQQLREQLQATLSGNYTLERELGGGGMSRVFVAEELRLGRKVVVKVLSPDLAQGLSVERFEREIKTVAALQQANIVGVLSAGDTNGLPFYTMPFVEGESLRVRLSRGPLAASEAIGVLRDVTRALSYAHAHGVVHRDIKPDNVLLSGGTAVVTDFGIAKAISAARTSAGATLTQIGTSIGTPAYMAPEQAAGDPTVDHRADIYSLGAMAYELLVGQVVFPDRTPQRMLAAHMGEPPKPISDFRGDLPAALADVVMRCLAKDPKDRPQQAGDVARVLDTITSGTGMQAMPPILFGGPGMLRKALAVYAAAFVAVAILAKAAIVGIGLPDWVFPGSLIVMALGLPVVLWTGYVHRVARRAMTMTPTYTPGGTPSVAGGTIATIALKAAPKMSWYRTTRGVGYALGVFVVMIALFMGMRTFGIGPFGSLMASGQMRANERILLTDFSVTSGDTSLGRVVSFAVRTGLSGSSVISVLDEGAVASALQRMQRPRSSRVDLALAREMAAREGAKVIVDGELTPVGGGYILVVRLVTADSGRELAVVRETGDGPKGLIDAADRVARKLRDKVGESLRSVQNAPQLARVTTPSLEALRKYSEAVQANSYEVDYPKAARLAREAVAVDSQFAEGWRFYAVVLSNMGAARAQMDSALRRAYELRNRLPERERNRIVGTYFGITGPGRDRAKAIAAYEAISYYNNLGNELHTRREFAKAESVYRAGIRVSGATTTLLAFGNLGRELLAQGKLDEADSLLSEQKTRFPNASVTRWRAVYHQYLHGDLDALQRSLDSARKVPDRAFPSLAAQNRATLALLRGRVREWRRYRAEAVAADSTAGRPREQAAEAATMLGAVMTVAGQAPAELRALDEALTRSPLRSSAEADRPYLWVAQQYAWAGQPDRARAILAQYRLEMKDTTLRRVQEPDLHTTLGAIALAERKPKEAIAEFRRGDMAPDGPANACTRCLPLYLSRAFDAAGMADSAIAQFELYLTTPQSGRFVEMLDASVVPYARERLGQAQEARGDTAKAAEHYRAFIELWKNADPELQPRVADARRRLAKLRPVEKQR